MDRAWMAKIPLGRVGEHRELADLAAFLLAGGSAYINGEVVTIDGGEWLKGTGQFSLMEALSEDDWAAMKDRKSTRLNPVTNEHLVCRLLLEKKKINP